MIIGKLIKDRYLHDVNGLGLYYDLAPLKRGAGDEGDFNARVDSENNRLKPSTPPGKIYRPTLFLLDSQINAMTDHWKNIIAPKSYLMVYRPGQHPSKIEIQFWGAYGNDVFWWTDNNTVYSKYDADGLGHRYRIAKESEVLGEPEPPQGGTDPIVIPPVYAEPKARHITGTTTVNKWGIFKTTYDVDIWIESEEAEE